jgi:hypothetical protein
MPGVKRPWNKPHPTPPTSGGKKNGAISNLPRAFMAWCSNTHRKIFTFSITRLVFFTDNFFCRSRKVATKRLLSSSRLSSVYISIYFTYLNNNKNCDHNGINGTTTPIRVQDIKIRNPSILGYTHISYFVFFHIISRILRRNSPLSSFLLNFSPQYNIYIYTLSE